MARYLYRRMNRVLWNIKFRAIGGGMLIFIAVAMYIAMGSMMPSASQTLEDKADNLKLSDYIIHVSSANESKNGELADIQGVDEVDTRVSISSRMNYTNDNGERDSIQAILIGVDAQTGPEINKLEILTGNFFQGNGSGTAILDKGFADREDIEIGETVGLLTGYGHVNLTVVGLTYSIEFGVLPVNPQSIMPFMGTLAAVYLPIDWLRGSFELPSDFVNDFLFLFDNGVNNKTVISEIDNSLSDNIILYSLEQDEISGYGLIKMDLEQGGAFVGVIAGLILMVAFFVIYSSLSRIIQEQKREIGVLRALGYSRGGVFLSYIYMAIVTGAISSVVGVIFGFPFAYWFTDFYVTEAMLTTASVHLVPFDLIVGGMIFGPLTAVLACGIATWSIVSMEPQDAIKGTLWGTRKVHRRKGAIRKRRSYITLFTIRSMFRQKVRTALMVLAIGFAIVMGSMSFLLVSSFDNSIQYSVEHGEHWDIIVDYAYPINESVALGISSDNIVERVQISKLIGYWNDSGEKEGVIIIGMDSSQTLHDFTIERGEMPQGSNEVMLSSDWASDHSIDVGNTVQIETSFGNRSLVVTGIVDDILGQFFVDIDAIDEIAGERILSGMYVRCAAGQVDEAKQELDESPLVANVQPRTNLESGMKDLLADYQDILYIFSVVSVSISSIAISNIIYVSILERQGEYGQLRALGYSKRDISKSVVIEIVVLVIIGAIVALPLLLGVMESFSGVVKDFWPIYTTIIYPQNWLDFLMIVGLTFTLGLIAVIPAMRFLGKMDVAKIVSGGRFG